jgi:hypothetical protein
MLVRTRLPSIHRPKRRIEESVPRDDEVTEPDAEECCRDTNRTDDDTAEEHAERYRGPGAGLDRAEDPSTKLGRNELVTRGLIGPAARPLRARAASVTGSDGNIARMR